MAGFTTVSGQAIELDTFYNDSFCIAAPLPFPNDTINLDSEHVACIEAIKAAALENAHRAWKDSIARLIADHINKQQCMSKPFAETFTVTHQSTEHHYTLYYYNQAGNLVQTIPPAGVHPLGTSSFPSGNWNGDPPLHDPLYITRYEYNSTGQVVNQLSADAGESTFKYDRAQRIRFAQNAEQQPDNDFAYTKYDGQGRIIETGELDSHIPTSAEISDQSFPDGSIVSVEEPVTTIYDFIDAPGTIPSDNTRNRIAKIENPYMSSFYDYDAHGNLKELTHLIPYLHDDTITMQYDYDLISGNVNEFRYEPSELDQLTQRFAYDADNRIQEAFSSTNGYLFDEDARYFYYLHGPLARVELGNDKVQGLDYYYTLQGWIKGVNMPGPAGPGYDPGYDGYISGHSNLNRYFGTDTMSYVLGYNDEDYKPIEGTSILSDPVNESFTGLGDEILGPSGHKGLFNGNIALTLTNNSIGTLGMAYQYDALHRIKFANSYDWGGSWSADHDYYIPEFEYDPNGNIQHQEIHGLANTDDLNYVYDSHHPNRLDHVTGGGAVTGLPSQSSGNYEYDEIGNLMGDHSDHTSMTWDVYGKLRTVDGGPEGSLDYTYDAQGNRLTKHIFPFNNIYVRDASGNIIAIYEHASEFSNYTDKVKEFNVYGSSRLGTISLDRVINSSFPEEIDTQRIASYRNLKTYELSNHLGNVLTTISDRKLGSDLNADGLADFYGATPMMSADYYPFGLEMPLRTTNSNSQRYGFNGKEKDTSIGSLTHYDYGFRIYNPAIGRFLSVDPLTRSYPMLTPYQFASNTPITSIDIDGEEGRDFRISAYGQTMGNSIINSQNYTQLFQKQMDVNRANETPNLQNARIGIATGLGIIGAGPFALLGPEAITMAYLYPISTIEFASGILSFGLGFFDPSGQFQIPGPFDDIGRSGRVAENKLAELLTETSGKKVLDFFGGSKSTIKGALNIDKAAEQGIRGTISQFEELAKRNNLLGTIDEITANNPQDIFLTEAANLLKSGGTLTVRGTKTNQYFQKIFNESANGFDNFETISRTLDVSKEGMKREDGMDIFGQVNEIILRRK